LKERTIMPIKLLIVGGVAGGATAATRARRLDEHAEIVLFERGEHVSFANCGLPYFIGEIIKEREDLLLTTPEALRARYAIDVRNFSEVMAVDAAHKQVTVRNTQTGETYRESYDKLILSPGAEPMRPPIEGLDLENIFSLRNIPDTDRIKAFVDSRNPESAVVVGGGFIGLEMAENLVDRGVKTTVIEMLDQVMAPLDFEMACVVHRHLEDKGVDLELGNGVRGFSQQGERIKVSTTKGLDLECDLVILSIGVQPESKLAVEAGLEVGDRGGIVVDAKMTTSDPDIFAVGDAVETVDFLTRRPTMVPLAGPANKQGRMAADNVMGRESRFLGTLGTAIVKVFDLTVACTGLNEKSLEREGIPYLRSYTHSGSHAGYYPGAERLTIKLLFSPGDGKILGAQIIGKEGVDKRIDVIATAIHAAMTVHDLQALELAYAPPFSSAKDPVNIAGFVASNLLKGDVENVYWHDLYAEENVLVDVRSSEEIEENGAVEGSLHIPLDELRERLKDLDRTKTYVLFCAIGLRGYIACRILVQNGFEAKNFSGGYEIYRCAVAETT
jgi:NADPH-dependent 2,4-dienoyl-CoA reductase/sulfur reductase-like enzyme/rhodanese-related sulfurtransferase